MIPGLKSRSTTYRQIEAPDSKVVHFDAGQPLRLDCGVDFAPLTVAYQTYGALNTERETDLEIEIRFRDRVQVRLSVYRPVRSDRAIFD
jgi:hypothetical protein